MNDQIRYLEYLKTHKRGDILEVATFRKGQLVNVDEFTKNDLLEHPLLLLAPKAIIRLENKTFCLILNDVEGMHIASGRKLAATTRLKKTSKIKIIIGDVVFILHFAPNIKTTKTERSLPIGVYLLLSFLLQFWVLNYCFEEKRNTTPNIPGDGHDCTFGVIFEREPNSGAFRLSGRGGALSEPRMDHVFSPYRDLDDAALYASLKSIQLSGQLSHRDIRSVFDVNQVAINTCKTRFPEADHSVSFTIYPSNKIQSESTTDFSTCAFQTIPK